MTTTGAPKAEKLRYPVNSPKDPAFGTVPRSEWQARVRKELLPLLGSHRWTVRRSSLLYFHDYMVQVYLDNWTLHFQVSIDGTEFGDEDRYGDLTGRALIAFDVEGARPGAKPSDIRVLQDAVRTALRDGGVYETLGVDESGCKAHHVVMEAIDADSIPMLAERLVTYMNEIYDTASPILDSMQNP